MNALIKIIGIFQQDQIDQINDRYSNVHADVSAVKSRITDANSASDVRSNRYAINTLESDLEIEDKRVSVRKRIKSEGAWLR